MHIVFGWGKNVSKTDLKYIVTSYTVSVASGNGSASGPDSCLPGHLSVSLEIPPNQDEKPAVDLYKFAKNQRDTAKEEGAGKIIVYEERDKKQPIQEIVFKNAWIKGITSSVSMGSQKFAVQMGIEAADMQISGVDFVDEGKQGLLT